MCVCERERDRERERERESITATTLLIVGAPATLATVRPRHRPFQHARCHRRHHTIITRSTRTTHSTHALPSTIHKTPQLCNLRVYHQQLHVILELPNFPATPTRQGENTTKSSQQRPPSKKDKHLRLRGFANRIPAPPSPPSPSASLSSQSPSASLSTPS